MVLFSHTLQTTDCYRNYRPRCYCSDYSYGLFALINTGIISTVLGVLILYGIGLGIYKLVVVICIIVRKVYQMIRRRLAARREDQQGSSSHSATERQGGPHHDYEQVEEGAGRSERAMVAREGGITIENQVYGSSA